MTRFLLDTSCMVAAVCSWHEHHRRTVDEIERRLNRGESLVVAAPALIEAYAVLTRLPPPHRLSSRDAHTVLETDFMRQGVEIVALVADDYRGLLRRATEQGIAGGGTYDTVILTCARVARVDALLTFNERQFRRLAEGEIEIAVPA